MHIWEEDLKAQGEAPEAGRQLSLYSMNCSYRTGFWGSLQPPEIQFQGFNSYLHSHKSKRNLKKEIRMRIVK